MIFFPKKFKISNIRQFFLLEREFSKEYSIFKIFGELLFLFFCKNSSPKKSLDDLFIFIFIEQGKER